MRREIQQSRYKDPRMHYRGENPSRLDNLTDAVFGIAITLLIFNSANPNSFEELLTFTKTLPAFLLSISFLILIWKEHLDFSRIYSLQDGTFIFLNTVFLALIIFYVYPLRFFTLFITNFVFNTGVNIQMAFSQVPSLMIYYGLAAAALYFVIFLFYQRVLKIKEKIQLNEFELFVTKHQRIRILIMMIVPLISVLLTILIKPFSIAVASIIGGFAYNLYIPLTIFWVKRFRRREKEFLPHTV